MLECILWSAAARGSKSKAALSCAVVNGEGIGGGAVKKRGGEGEGAEGEGGGGWRLSLWLGLGVVWGFGGWVSAYRNARRIVECFFRGELVWCFFVPGDNLLLISCPLLGSHGFDLPARTRDLPNILSGFRPGQEYELKEWGAEDSRSFISYLLQEVRTAHRQLWGFWIIDHIKQISSRS